MIAKIPAAAYASGDGKWQSVRRAVHRLIADVEALTKERDELVESYVEALAQVKKHMALHDRECCKLIVTSVATFLEDQDGS